MRKRGCLKPLAGVSIMTIAMFAVLFALKLSWDTHFYDAYDPSAALNVQMRGTEDRPAYKRIEFTFDGVPGEPVPTLLALPRDVKGPFPALVFLHGIGQQSDFLDEIAGVFTKEGYAICCFDQLMQGERKVSDKSYPKQALEFRRRAAATVNETRRLIDYLVTRPDIDPNRIFLLGASYGAITGSVAAGFDKRIKGAILCYGGGDIRKLIDSKEGAKALGPALTLVQSFASWFLAPSDPVRYVGMISPRPVLLQAGRRDSIVPPAASQALMDAAREPKDIIWYDSDHVGLDRDHVITVLNDAVTWLKKHDKP
jgi:dienelactone hydrolase